MIGKTTEYCNLPTPHGGGAWPFFTVKVLRRHLHLQLPPSGGGLCKAINPRKTPFSPFLYSLSFFCLWVILV